MYSWVLTGEASLVPQRGLRCGSQCRRSCSSQATVYCVCRQIIGRECWCWSQVQGVRGWRCEGIVCGMRDVVEESVEEQRQSELVQVRPTDAE